MPDIVPTEGQTIGVAPVAEDAQQNEQQGPTAEQQAAVPEIAKDYGHEQEDYGDEQDNRPRAEERHQEEAGGKRAGNRAHRGERVDAAYHAARAGQVIQD